MSRLMRIQWMMLATVALLFTACATRPAYVAMQPDEPYYDQPVSPYQGAVWISGDYVWRGGHYVRSRGYYAKPRRNQVYQKGYWQHTRHGYTWKKGQWH